MSATSSGQVKLAFLTTLVLVLLVFASVQAWYLFEMKKQLDVIQKQLSSASSAAVNTSKDEAPRPAASDTKTQEDKPINGQQQVLSQQENQPPQPEQAPPSVPRQTQASNTQGPVISNTPPLNYPDKANNAWQTPAWKPYEQIEQMQRDMDRMFDRRVNRFKSRPWYSHPEFQRHFRQNLSAPEINIKENAHQYNVFVYLPGADEKDISVTLNGQRLTIKGKKQHKKQSRDNAGNIILQERRSGLFQRSITLAHPVKQNQMQTRLDDGVLKIIIPKETPY